MDVRIIKQIARQSPEVVADLLEKLPVDTANEVRYALQQKQYRHHNLNGKCITTISHEEVNKLWR